MHSTTPIPVIAEKPPDYDFVIFHKSRPEDWDSRTAGAADQAYQPYLNSMRFTLRQHQLTKFGAC